MTQTELNKTAKMYNRLFDHCQKQYKNVKSISKAYIKDGQVFAIEYITTYGIHSIPSCTFDADKVIIFK